MHVGEVFRETFRRLHIREILYLKDIAYLFDVNNVILVKIGILFQISQYNVLLFVSDHNTVDVALDLIDFIQDRGFTVGKIL